MDGFAPLAGSGRGVQAGGQGTQAGREGCAEGSMHRRAIRAESMARAIAVRAGANPIPPVHDLRPKLCHDFGNSRFFGFCHGKLQI